MPEKYADEIVRIAKVSDRSFTNFISGQCTEAVILGCLCFIGMIIFRFPFALTISVLVGFTALIPIFGAFIGTAVGAFLIFVTNPLSALWFILFILILQQIEGKLDLSKSGRYFCGTSLHLGVIGGHCGSCFHGHFGHADQCPDRFRFVYSPQ